VPSFLHANHLRVDDAFSLEHLREDLRVLELMRRERAL
jgi:hypothetical protein